MESVTCTFSSKAGCVLARFPSGVLLQPLPSTAQPETRVCECLQSTKCVCNDCLQEIGVKFHRPAQCVLQQGAAKNPDSCQWFPGALLNIAECALQVNDPDAPALVYGHSTSPDRCGLRLHSFFLKTNAFLTARMPCTCTAQTLLSACQPVVDKDSWFCGEIQCSPLSISS